MDINKIEDKIQHRGLTKKKKIVPFKKINKTDKSLVRVLKNEGTNNIRNKSGEIIHIPERD